MRIHILGQPSDAEVDLLSRRLKERGADTVTIDISDFPPKTRLEIASVGQTPVIRLDGAVVSDADAWYIRRFGHTHPLLRGELTKEGWAEIYGEFNEWCHVENQKSMTVASMLSFLADMAPVVNPPEAFFGHIRKPHQCHAIRKAGLPVPDFLVTNDPEGVRAFIDRHPRVVYKPVAGGRHTREIDRAYFDTRAHALATEPILVQALAEGRHCRAYVAGDRVIGAGEILFDKEVRIDYRASSRGAERIELSPEIQEQCIRAARATGMDFTGLDVIVDEAAGTHTFLECNPSPMFANFERMTGIPVSEGLADLLVDRAKG